MSVYGDKNQENKGRSIEDLKSKRNGSGSATSQFVDNRSVTIAQKKLQNMANKHSDVHQQIIQNKVNTKVGYTGSSVVQRIEFTDEALQAAITTIKSSNLTPAAIARGYEAILDDDQRNAITKITELRNLLRHKDVFDERHSARKYTSQALGYINYIDPTNITGGLNKIEQALHAMQMARAAYHEIELGSVTPLLNTPQPSYGGLE
ncbi:hypothetical protein [Reinekea sp. G2M2-21]|uniref:hypothetical protein n=1 Tax=Reinekea sp. G2M2-21 TaxID=2788942 RepID=UPI0018AC7671|nr:hypothetical protein [Reinekea sp. G2M2-21]